MGPIREAKSLLEHSSAKGPWGCALALRSAWPLTRESRPNQGYPQDRTPLPKSTTAPCNLQGSFTHPSTTRNDP